MRGKLTLLAMAALAQGLGNATYIKPDNSMGSNPFYMPSKSRRVKNKLNRLRKLR